MTATRETFAVPKPLMILDQHFRKKDELFSADTWTALSELCDVVGGEDRPMPDEEIAAHLGAATFLVAARPKVSQETLDAAPSLRAIMEVSGAFHGEVDYTACFARGFEVLSCAPGFRQSVAEMGLAMLLAAGRGLVAEHEAFRRSDEQWLADRDDTDFTLFRQRIGFVGYGNIARELHRLLAPFAPSVSAYDPWLTTFPEEVEPASLEDVFRTCRAVVVTAVPAGDNEGMVSGSLINSMVPGGALVLLSRAHVIDFDAALAAASAGRITFATDVYPTEPVATEAPLRQAEQTIHSPHRAAAVPGGRHLIGDMLLHDVRAILEGRPERQFLAADPDRVDALVKAQKAIESAGKLANT